jgi:pimeloyl-ACP methyl ester carboxylesterase
VDGASDQLLSRASLARDQDRGVGGRHLRQVSEDGLQRWGRADDLLEHERLIDLFAQGQVFVLEPVFQPPDFLEGGLQRRLRLPLLGDIHAGADVLDDLARLVQDRMADGVKVGYLFLDRTKFRESFAADVAPDASAFMADSQVPWGLEALNGAVTEPAWRTKPSWYLVSTEDKMIPPDAQRAMSMRMGSTVVEVRGSHAVYVSQPQSVAAIITKAAYGAAVVTQ